MVLIPQQHGWICMRIGTVMKHWKKFKHCENVQVIIALAKINSRPGFTTV